MSYEIHITRAKSYLEDDDPVLLSDVLDCWGTLPAGFSVNQTGSITAVTPQGQRLTAFVNDYLVYQEDSDQDSRIHIYFEPERPPFFTVRREEQLRPVIALAEKLGAIVQGDEEEIYTLINGRVAVLSEDEQKPPKTPIDKLRRWLGGKR